MATIQELGIRLTSPEGSYWNHNGAYQTEGDRLYEEMVPSTGAAATLNGELIRGINRLFHEYCNNGNCNAAVPHFAGDRDWWDVDENEDDCDPDEIVDVTLDSYYGKFIDLIEDTLPSKIDSKEVHAITDRIREIIENGAYNPSVCSYFSKENVNVYSRMCDLVIWYVLNTPDAELPASYDRN